MATTLTDRDDGTQLRVHVGDSLDVDLTENATTGYRWAPDSLDPHQFELAGRSGSYPSGAVGSGGTAQFQIKILATGKGTLRFKYWREWEGDAGVVKRFTVLVDVS